MRPAPLSLRCARPLPTWLTPMPHSLSELFALVWSGWLAAWPSGLIAVIWIGWLISWAVASFWSGRTQKRVMTWDAQAYRIPIIAGALLLKPWTAQALAVPPGPGVGNTPSYRRPAVTFAGALPPSWG